MHRLPVVSFETFNQRQRRTQLKPQVPVAIAIAIAIDIHNFIVPSATPTVELAATARNSNYSCDPLAFSITRFSPKVFSSGDQGPSL
jgi:hypothetical protein